MKKVWNWLLIENNRKVLSFLGTALVVITTGIWTYFTYFEQVEKKVHLEKSPLQTIPDKITKNNIEMPFVGVYTGINTQGNLQQATKITFRHSTTGKVTGTYTLSGMLGKMDGNVKGNTYTYKWKLGGFSGRGVSIILGDTINGTWGYYSSDTNGGSISAQLQKKSSGG